MSVAPCEHSLSILHAQHHCVWRRPPRPVLGSFHLLLPLVEISFVSVPAARGLDHLELCKHPCPAPHQPQASLAPAEAPVRLSSGWPQPLSARCQVPSTFQEHPVQSPPRSTGIQSMSSQRPHPSKSLLPHGCSWPSMKPPSLICSPISNWLLRFTLCPSLPPQGLALHPSWDYVDTDLRIHIHSHFSLAPSVCNCQRPEPGSEVEGVKVTPIPFLANTHVGLIRTWPLTPSVPGHRAPRSSWLVLFR